MNNDQTLPITDVAGIPGLSGRAVPRVGLSTAEIDSMYRLLDGNFHGVLPEVFRKDLEEKNWVILLEDGQGRLRGFSTFLMYRTEACGRPMIIVCSGDTIVEPSAWGSTALPRAWIRAVYRARQDFPEGELYWLLLTSGFRTYRFMSVFCREFLPRYDGPEAAIMRGDLDLLGEERFGNRFDKRTGIVKFPKPQTLRDWLGTVPEGRHADPHVRFFLERNPGHAEGDELVSLASLARENLTPAGLRMAR